jgi:predicted Zn finger-like uncharacterized protein
MNVSCPECTTIFRVDPAKVPGTGVRARCSECSGVFHVGAPSTGGSGEGTRGGAEESPELPGGFPSEPASAVRPPVDATYLPGGWEAADDEGSWRPGESEDDGWSGEEAAAIGSDPGRGPMDLDPSGGPADQELDELGEMEPLPTLGSAEDEPEAAPTALAMSDEGDEAGAAGASAYETAEEERVGSGVSTKAGDADRAASPIEDPAQGDEAPVAEVDIGDGMFPSGGTTERAVDATSFSPAGTADPLPPPPFGSADPETRARRLARALVSDIVVYHPERRERSLRDGTIRQEFREEIRRSWEEYVTQVGRQVARETTYFQDALNEILAGGKRFF